MRFSKTWPLKFGNVLLSEHIKHCKLIANLQFCIVTSMGHAWCHTNEQLRFSCNGDKNNKTNQETILNCALLFKWRLVHVQFCPTNAHFCVHGLLWIQTRGPWFAPASLCWNEDPNQGLGITWCKTHGTMCKAAVLSMMHVQTDVGTKSRSSLVWESELCTVIQVSRHSSHAGPIASQTVTSVQSHTFHSRTHLQMQHFDSPNRTSGSWQRQFEIVMIF